MDHRLQDPDNRTDYMYNGREIAKAVLVARSSQKSYFFHTIIPMIFTLNNTLIIQVVNRLKPSCIQTNNLSQIKRKLPVTFTLLKHASYIE